MSSDPFPLTNQPVAPETSTTTSTSGSHESIGSPSGGPRQVEVKPKPGPRKRKPDPKKRKASGRTRRATITSYVEVYRIEPMAALRVSAAFFLCVYLMLVIAVTALVVGGLVTGLTSGFTDFLADIGWEDVKVNIAQLAIGVTLAGSIFVVASSLMTSFLVVFYNLISEVVGGFKIVLSDETVSVNENVVDANLR